MPVLNEFYIITNSGACIYSRSQQSEIDQTLFAGFLTALNSFSKEMSADGINAFSIGKFKYVISSAEEILFIGRADIKAKNEDVLKIIKEMQDIFFQNFSADKFLHKWDGSVPECDALDQAFDRFLLDSEEKMRSAIW